MFQFPPFAPRLLQVPGLLPGGLPHSGIRGSLPACKSPRLIAACHALHRLWDPRHPPCALFLLLFRALARHYRLSHAPLRPQTSKIFCSAPPASDAAVCLVALNIFWKVQRKTPMGLQKGGVPAAPSGTATLLRLNPSHRFYPRALLAVTHFRSPRLPWFDGRCVQGPGTYSPHHG